MHSHDANPAETLCTASNQGSPDKCLAKSRRRLVLGLGAAPLILAAHQRALALEARGLDAFSSKDLQGGIATALQQGAQAAVVLLGRPGGFLDNPKVRIPLPGFLEKAAGPLKFAGMGGTLDELVQGMNRAAEKAVPLGKDLLSKAIQTMTVQDAKKILGGGDTAVTDFFSSKTRSPLGTAFMPVVKKTVGQVGAAKTYNDLAGKASSLGLIRGEQASLEGHVTSRTLDGLYTIIGEEEKKIRQNPMAAGSAIAQKVFGAIR